MYKKINITENHLKIISLFTKSFDKSHYIREVSKLLKISPRTAQIILSDLEKKAVLESKIMGKIKTYKLKNNQISNEYLIFCEQYKKIAFLESNSLIKEIISQISQYIEGISIIFGSYSNYTKKKESDLDIFIIGKYNEKEINKISKIYDLEINIKQYPMRIFKQEIKKDPLLKEIISNHIILSGSEEFIKLSRL
jgi:uncharacterized protein